MAQSASIRRQSTLRRITVAAQELAIERGYDGFTLDDLAAAVGVSRRTLFNHVSGKEEAVVGVRPDFDPVLVERFRAGGPTGDLFDDLLLLIVELLDREDASREDAGRFHRLLETNPQLTPRVHRELERVCTEAVEMASVRPGEGDRQRAGVVVVVLGALVAHAMNEYLRADDTVSLVDHLRTAAETARQLLA
ncbi:TetR/AcrR family transcriptional regulator [Terracoccus luteus]|uniref:AcrR family transcriptional regulator n=1 Tax=Terracoccus luteus TaxID=53356 RepID=A0A839Q1M9_9MICO|nr:TetR/AcrR family transcriptional regulator [Terracoccus luteus]MBB2986541.1 AcrR family transcriptional regulator [Terracoccus luteus]MCP2171870.1 AcrR family transcriptional regulator [Terracoccus luteus]